MPADSAAGGDGPRRIAIVGNGGAGKSTLARTLGRRLGVPVIHLDREHWLPGWVAPPDDAWRARVRELAAGERWVIDGNYGGTMEERFEAADTIIFLDFPRLICAWRVIRRATLHRRHPRPDMAGGCSEHLDPAFIRWVWTYNSRSRPGILATLDRYTGSRGVYILRNSADVKRFLELFAPSERG